MGSRWSDADRKVARARIVDRYGPADVTVLDWLRREHEWEGWT